MESLTKNKKEQADIIRIISGAFPGENVQKTEELKEGYFNAAYAVTLGNGKEVVLKIAPSKDVLTMSCEKNIMYSEVTAMKLVREQTDVPVAEIYAYDTSENICNAPYFIMEKLTGKSLADIDELLSDDEKRKIHNKTGRLTRKINGITGKTFGYLGQPEMQGPDWYAVFVKMMELAVEDASKKEIDLQIDTEKMFRGLAVDRICFEEVQTPKLVHWDLWAGNIFVDNGNVTGVIDFERAIWGDPLLEVGFRSYEQNADFLEGYGKDTFTEKERRRIYWYDIYLFLVTALEYEYRKYETNESYMWATDKLKAYVI